MSGGDGLIARAELIGGQASLAADALAQFLGGLLL